MTTALGTRFSWIEAGGGEEAGKRCIAFVESVGIGVRARREGEVLDQPIEGLAIKDGAIVIDPEVPIWPGDFLHEAGHIAVTEADRRSTLSELEADRDEELMAIAWSYAATRECGMTLRQLFNPEGYRDQAKFAGDCYALGRFDGADGLARYGMTILDLQEALANGLPSYPNMIRWLR
jgi:hypothetical protein